MMMTIPSIELELSVPTMGAEGASCECGVVEGMVLSQPRPSDEGGEGRVFTSLPSDASNSLKAMAKSLAENSVLQQALECVLSDLAQPTVARPVQPESVPQSTGAVPQPKGTVPVVEVPVAAVSAPVRGPVPEPRGTVPMVEVPVAAVSAPVAESVPEPRGTVPVVEVPVAAVPAPETEPVPESRGTVSVVEVPVAAVPAPVAEPVPEPRGTVPVVEVPVVAVPVAVKEEGTVDEVGPKAEALIAAGVVPQVPVPQVVDVAATVATPTVTPVEIVRQTVAAVPLQPTEVLVQAAQAVADTMLVSPGLLRGQGEVRIQLKPDVLEGSEIRIAVTGRELKVEFSPQTTEMAVLIEKCTPQLTQHLAERVHLFQIAVEIRRREQDKEKV